MLALGAGFNQTSPAARMSSNASLYGLTPQEINAKLDQILSFAEIGPFIDQPVRTYSSGMYVRLALR
jgi:ABC-type polysaccharide/polyol phosphate transport system ATPase subunit